MKYLRTIPKYGDHSDDAKLLQEALGVSDDVKLLQEALGVTADGWFGDKTLKALKAYQKSRGLPGTGVIPANGGKTLKSLGFEFCPAGEKEIEDSPSVSDNFFGAPWVGVRVDLLGRKETDSELSKWLVPEWKKEGLNFKDLIGRTHAWCSVLVNAKLRAVGVKGTDSAGAASHSRLGKSCPFWFGCIIPIRHKSGGRHVCIGLYWIDEKRKIAATMDGNRSNKYAINRTDLSGKGDTVVGGYRWPEGVPSGQLVSMSEVLKKYPFLKVGNTGTSTR